MILNTMKRFSLLNKNKEVDFRIHHVINLTPILDLMLVLLVIFIISASGIVTSSINLNLPTRNDKNQIIENDYLEILIDKDLNIYISKTQMKIENISQYLVNMNLNKDQKIALKIDQNLLYKDVIHVMSKIIDAGYENLNLITEN